MARRKAMAALAAVVLSLGACGSEKNGSGGGTGGDVSGGGGQSSGGNTATGATTSAGGSGESGGSGGEGGQVSCDIGCTPQQNSSGCTEMRVMWNCAGSYDHEFMAEGRCQDVPSGAIRFCCPPEFLPECR